MSVIAWDGKVVASDRQSTAGSMAVMAKKIWRLDSGGVIAIAGHLERGLLRVRWYRSGAKPELWPRFEGETELTMVVFERGHAWEFEQEPVAIPVRAKKMAWGSGTDFAMGAMEAGADAAKAVRIASKYDIYSGLGVNVLKLPD